jgi:hypothetical protein
MREFLHSRLSRGTDPFAERIAWFKNTGRCFALLKNLLYDLPIIHELVIVNEHGFPVGQMKVAITPGVFMVLMDWMLHLHSKHACFELVCWSPCHVIQHFCHVVSVPKGPPQAGAPATARSIHFETCEYIDYNRSMIEDDEEDEGLASSISRTPSVALSRSNSDSEDMFSTRSRSLSVSALMKNPSLNTAVYPLTKRRGDQV